jgi:hypothetical protein
MIVRPKSDTKHPLLFQRPGELSLPAYMQLDMARETVTFGYWPRNSEPLNVTLRNDKWWPINERLSSLAAAKVAKGVEPLLDRICKGYSVVWDGRNHVGALNADAEFAKAEVTKRLQKLLYPEPQN